MINKKIHELPVVSGAVNDTDLVAIVQGVGTSPETRKVNIASLRTSLAQQLIVNTTYDELSSLIQSGDLVPGAYYRFEYQTIHKIPYTNVVNTGPVEVLLAFAISANKIDHKVFSESHPEDIIYWRWDDNVLVDQVEDVLMRDVNYAAPNNPPPTIFGEGVTAYAPLTNRPGRIYYREDTMYRVSTPYDFRAVKFRRWKLKDPINIVSTVKGWVDETAYTQGDIINNSGTYYMAITTFNNYVGSSISLYTIDLTSLLDDIKGRLSYFSPTPDTYTLIPPSGPYSGLILEVDNTEYCDFTTFDNRNSVASSNPDVSDIIKNFNCHIKSYVPAWLEQVAWEYYPNIVFFNFANNIEIDVFSENLSINNSCNLRIGSYNKFGYINTFNSFLCETSIGNNNDYIFLTSQANDTDISNANSQYQKIGAGNNGVIISSSNNFNIGNRNYGLYMAVGSRNIVGDCNTMPIFVSNNADCKLGDHNLQITFATSAVRTECGNNNVKGLFQPNSSSNKVGNNNFDFSGLLNSGTSVEGVYIGLGSGNIIGNNTSGIRFVGNFNVFYDNCNSVTTVPPVALNNCKFEVKNASGIKFYSASEASFNIVDVYFKVPVTIDGMDIEIDSQSGSFLSGLNYNQSVGALSHNSIFARTVTEYTDRHNYKEALIQLYID